MRTYSFKKQLQNKGCYAEIIFDVRFSVEASNNLSVDYSADTQWELACKAGVLVFYDYFVRKKRGNLEVSIYEIKWLPIDTNNLIILFVTIKALCDALTLVIENLTLDIEREIFQFPEIRSGR